jgi:Tfp pilus assembly protein PilW
MALLLLVMASMMTVFTSIQRTTVKQEQRAHGRDDVRVALERITKDLRQASAINTGSGGALLDMQTYVNGTATRVVYTASGTNLTRTVGSTSRVILGRLSSTSLFTYAPAAPAATLVGVTLGIHPYPTDTSTVVSLSSDVRLRNR